MVIKIWFKGQQKSHTIGENILFFTPCCFYAPCYFLGWTKKRFSLFNENLLICQADKKGHRQQLVYLYFNVLTEFSIAKIIILQNKTFISLFLQLFNFAWAWPNGKKMNLPKKLFKIQSINCSCNHILIHIFFSLQPNVTICLKSYFGIFIGPFYWFEHTPPS